VDLDIPGLTERVAALVAQPVSDVRRMTGGASSLTFTASIDPDGSAQPAVIKVAPPGLAPTLNRDVLRQARILRALAPAQGIPVPSVLGEDLGEPPEVPPLFVMTRAPGGCIEPITHPTEHDLPTPEEVEARALAAAGILAAIHDCDLEALGITDEPVMDLSAEVQRWMRVFSTTPEDLSTGAQAVGEALLGSLPGPVPPKLIHGDFRLGNLVCEGLQVTAVIDWEIWAVGDPRIDLGWWMMSTHPSKQPNALRVAEGMPDDRRLIAAYEAAAGPTVADLTWFDALSRYKAGAMTALILKHDRRSEDRNPVVEAWDPHVPTGFVRLAAECLES